LKLVGLSLCHSLIPRISTPANIGYELPLDLQNGGSDGIYFLIISQSIHYLLV